VVELADLVMLVLVPGLGDEIQALKAGIMEIGDIFIINKKDLDGALKLKPKSNTFCILKPMAKLRRSTRSADLRHLK
jgi:LAO/AO transport system kinase